MELPRVIPLFPLPNVVLFPGLALPLHIFEPRYRTMLRDASEGDGMIGMMLMRAEAEANPAAGATVFNVGCAGEIVKAEALPDGRSNILLHGIREFRIEREIAGKPYRQAEVTWVDYDAAPLAAEQRADLVATLKELLSAVPEESVVEILDDDSIADAVLVNFFSFILDVPVLEKQMLLDEPTLAGRAERLRGIVAFRRAAAIAGVDADKWH